jgi:glutamyl-tRNA synthetase
MNSQVKVRFAPSPTGILHVGGIRTALFNYFFAKSKNGVFVLRNEDTDQTRKVEGSLEATLESLRWLGVEWNELVTQSERLSHYKEYANQLVSKGLAHEEEGAIRFISPKEGTTSWTDAIGNKDITFDNKNIEDFIILKKDGFPTYHLANVVDDHLMEITHVIRGEDWIPSAPKHIMLYMAFGWDIPVFAHVPNVLGTDGKKLSKRKGAKSVLDFKKEGYLPEALLNYLMLLGWSPKNDKEILSKEEIEKEFSLDNINVAPSIFDEKKLLWMNGEYIRQLKPFELAKRIKDYDSTVSEGVSEADFIKFVVSAQTRIKTLADFKSSISPFVNPIKPESTLLKDYATELGKVIDWKSPMISGATISFMQSQNIKYNQIYQDLIGQKQGLPLGDVFEILGKEKTLELLK